MRVCLQLTLFVFAIVINRSSSAPGRLSSSEEVLLITTVGSVDSMTESKESWENDTNDLNSGTESSTNAGGNSNSEGLKRTNPEEQKDKNVQPSKPHVYSFRVHSDIKYRYSKTYVTSRVVNPDFTSSKEVTFRVVLPETAFISKFIMEIDGKSYEASVKEKEDAKRVYSYAQSQGQSAGLVEARHSNVFDVNVNIGAQSKVTFNLTYEELLSRRLGKYEQVIHINPEEITSVKDFQISVNITESQNISFVQVPRASGNDKSIMSHSGEPEVTKSGKNAFITWSPKNIGKLPDTKFTVQYDIERNNSQAGEVLVMEGYFVHFFAPDALKPLRKHVTFILDISGSMSGRRMEQMKAAQKKILDDLQSDDFFNIITFSSGVTMWTPDTAIDTDTHQDYIPIRPYGSSRPEPLNDKNQKPIPASMENIQKAKTFIDALYAQGGTNIHDAVITGLNLVSGVRKMRENAEIEIEELPQPRPTGSEDLTTDGTPKKNASGKGLEIETIKHNPQKIPVLPKNVESLIIFLTDGEPTVGITEPSHIQELVQKANKNLSVPIFSLGFGEGADFPFLKRLSLQNHGFARKIYEHADADIQLKGFYNEIASPLLSNVKFNYTSPDYNIIDLSVAKFHTMFSGTEIVVTGQLVPVLKNETYDQDAVVVTEMTTTAPLEEDTSTTSAFVYDDAPSDPSSLVLADKDFLEIDISGLGREGAVKFKQPSIFCQQIDYDIISRPFPPRPTPAPTPEDAFLERLWAYLTIQQLIEKDQIGDDPKDNEVMEKPVSTTVPSLDKDMMRRPNSKITASRSNLDSTPETSKQKAIRLALKYGFVTPFTSLVVVKPNVSDIANAVSADDKDKRHWLVDRIIGGYQPQPIMASPYAHHAISMGTRAASSGRPRPHSGTPGKQSGPAAMRVKVFGRRPPAISIDSMPYSTSRRPAAVTQSFGSSVESEGETTATTTIIDTTTTSAGTDNRFNQLEKIPWVNSTTRQLNVNGSNLLILKDEEYSLLDDDRGYACNVSMESGVGRCVHLQDCIQSAFVGSQETFLTSYFCPIANKLDKGQRYVGICCSDFFPTELSSLEATTLMPSTQG